jgi:hypothetical protein
MWGGRGGEYGARTPVELRETREHNRETEIGIPLEQALIIGACWGYTLVISPVIAIIAAGNAAFWLITGIWMFTTFWWYLWRSGNLVTEDRNPIVEEYEEGVCNSLMWLEIVTGCAMSAMAGGIAFCFHKVLAMIEFSPPWWLRFITEGGGRLIGIAQLPMSIVMSVFVLLAFGQELAQRSPFQEQFIWKALGAILENFGGKAITHRWHGPVIVRERNGKATPGVQVVQRNNEMTPEQRQAAMMREFIERGAEIGFSRRLWVGKSGRDLAALGRKLSDSEYRYLVGILKEAKLMEADNSGTRLTCNPAEAIARVVAPE